MSCGSTHLRKLKAKKREGTYWVFSRASFKEWEFAHSICVCVCDRSWPSVQLWPIEHCFPIEGWLVVAQPPGSDIPHSLLLGILLETDIKLFLEQFSLKIFLSPFSWIMWVSVLIFLQSIHIMEIPIPTFNISFAEHTLWNSMNGMTTLCQILGDPFEWKPRLSTWSEMLFPGILATRTTLWWMRRCKPLRAASMKSLKRCCRG